MVEEDTDGPPRIARAELGGWLAGCAATATAVAAALRLLESGHRELPTLLGLGAFGLVVVGVLLLGRREPGARRCAAGAGAAAGVLVGVALAQRAPTAWFMQDVAWHTAKATLTAAGHPLQDPILRVPTVYPFAFGVLTGVPVALGASVRTVMWAASALSLLGTLASFWLLARSFARPAAAAWTAVALPFVFYAPAVGYWLLPNPCNASLPLVFAGLAAVARGTTSRRGGTLALGGLALGLAGLLWYGHLPWLALFAALWGWGRWRELGRLVLGAALPALALVAHLAVVATAGNLASSGVTSAETFDRGERLAAMGRNLLTLMGETSLADGPWWIGLLVGLALVAALLRRPPGGLDARRVLRSFAVPVLACLVLAGLCLTYWRPFSWRYAFLFWSACTVAVGAARPVSMGGRSVGPIVVLGLAALVSVPWMTRNVVWFSIEVARTYEEEVLPLAAAIDAHVAPDEPILASTETWETGLACGAPRPTLVDRNGGTYKYAPARLAGPRWETAERVKAATDRDAVLAALAPYAFRFALVSRRDRTQGPGYGVLATSFEPVYESAAYVLVDLSSPR